MAAAAALSQSLTLGSVPVISMSSTLSGSFSYVFIPANEEAPIEQREGDKSGGLSEDALVKTAKEYFFQQSGGAARAEALNNAPPEEQKEIAQKMRSQILAGNPNAESQLAKMDDTALLDLARYVFCEVWMCVLSSETLIMCIPPVPHKQFLPVKSWH